MQATPNECFPATRTESIFCRRHPRHSRIFTHNPYVLNILSATSTQSIFWPTTRHSTD